jgi:hypothetical protein
LILGWLRMLTKKSTCIFKKTDLVRDSVEEPLMSSGKENFFLFPHDRPLVGNDLHLSNLFVHEQHKFLSLQALNRHIGKLNRRVNQLRSELVRTVSHRFSLSKCSCSRCACHDKIFTIFRSKLKMSRTKETRSCTPD